jgi:predicted membrane protein (TIGR00267 family)
MTGTGSMTSSGPIKFERHLTQAHGIIRRYAIVNGFDGALTMLGLLSGFMLGGGAPLPTMMAACIGAAVALGVSGLTSAYLSESAERRRSLAELESAMITDLRGSDHARAARLLPWLVAIVNGASPVLVSLLIITPLWLAQLGVLLPLEPVLGAIVVAFVCIFGLGAFLGRVAGTSWLFSGTKTLLIALATMLLILAL